MSFGKANTGFLFINPVQWIGAYDEGTFVFAKKAVIK
jgi:hypothetical protein